MMILRRAKKKKQKKAAAAAALLEAQQSAIYRPPSTISVPVTMHDEFEQSGSDDLETESLSLTGDYYGLSTLKQIDYVRPASPPSQRQYQPSPQQPLPPTYSTPTTIQFVQQPVSIPTTSVIHHSPSDYGIRKTIVQPSQQPNMVIQSPISYVPQTPSASLPPIATTTIMEHPPSVVKEPQIVQQIPTTSVITTTLPRSSHKKASSIHKVMIDPAKAELIKTSVAFGLGRGIDATNKSPWMNKSSFQVRRVHNSIVDTNEGNAVGSYQHDLLSISDMEDLYAASLNIPETPVTIHVECDNNRSISSSRQVIGKKVITRTIGFQTDNEEKYTDGESPRNGKESHAIPKDPSDIVYNTQNSSLTFEDRVCLWLLHKIAHKCYLIGQRFEIKHDDSPTNQLMKLIQSSKSVIQVDDEIKAGCKELVQALRVTHYVTSIKLGAAEYRIMSDGEYQKQVAKGGAFGLDTIAEAATTGFANMKQTKKEANKMAMKISYIRKIGTIKEDNTVEKGSPGEVVLTVQVQPITRLIRLPTVKMALRDALEIYMEGTLTSEGILYILSLYLISLCIGGPFVIKCTGRDLYLTVNKFNNYEVEGTEIPAEASLFYLHSTDDGKNPFDFHIAYYGEDVGPDQGVSKESDIGRYLEAKINPKGSCPGPLLMKHSVKVRNTRFTLRSRLSKKASKSHISNWIAGEDAFYIACSTKKYQHDSYLALKHSRQTDLLGKHFFMTECVPSIHLHNGDNIFMLFQTLPRSAVVDKCADGRGTPGKLPIQPSELKVKTETLAQ